MGAKDKLLKKILLGQSDKTISFDDLRSLLLWLGFEERTRGSHHVFVKQGVEELINLQKSGSEAKSYQVKQVRKLILKYQLRGEA